MKKLLIIAALFFCSYSFSQSTKNYADFSYINDTLIFEGRKIVPGDTLQLGFGSGANKNFLFVLPYNKNIASGPGKLFFPKVVLLTK